MTSILSLVDDVALATPERVALAASDRADMTYGGLAAHARRTAAALQTIGIASSDRVAIVFRNGADAATAFLGVSAVAGCAPLNPLYSADEFAFYMEDLGATLLLTRDGAAPAAIEAAGRLQIPIVYADARDNEPAGAFAVRGFDPVTECDESTLAKEDDVALVLHTSGTTSKPKLVPLSHANLMASARHVSATLALTPADRCLNVMPLFHIHGLVAALLSSLRAGASMACSTGFDAKRFHTWMQEFSPTWYTAVPTMHQSVLAGVEGDTPAYQHRLRLIRSSSAALPPTVLARLETTFGVPVIEAYGMTEAAHQMTSNPLPPAQRKPGSVGVAAGPRVAIIDDGGNEVARGRLGEIAIRGPNVTRGYEANPEANAKAFTNGWFRTGDQGRMDDDAYVFITGRLKEIINRGGEKISPREIDEALLEHPAVAQASAFSVPHATLGEDVAAVVVLRPGSAASEQELRDFAFAKLADFKVPSSIVIADEIPKGPTGKVQRVLLAKQLEGRLRAAYVAPRDIIETLVAGAWAKALEADKVGADDNFFMLGGDSLLAVEIVSRTGAMFGVELPRGTMFRNATVAAFAAEVRKLARPERIAAIAQTMERVAAMSDAEVKGSLSGN